jgi:hypothetical protein
VVAAEAAPELGEAGEGRAEINCDGAEQIAKTNE